MSALLVAHPGSVTGTFPPADESEPAMRPAPLLAASTLVIASLTACSSSGGNSSPSPSTSTKVSFADAVKSKDAATKACQTLIGDGSKQKWVTSIDDTNGTTVDGAPLSRDGGRTAFECTISGKAGGYNTAFYVMQGREGFDYEVAHRLDSTSTKAHIASAWNADAEVGAITENARESQNQTAVDDLQSIANQIGK